MQWVFAIIIIFTLIDIEDKIKKLSYNQENSNDKKKINQNKKIVLQDYLNKDVYIILKDDTEMYEQHLFYAGAKNKGKIVDYDDEWIIFDLIKKKEKISYYIKIVDIESIEEIK